MSNVSYPLEQCVWEITLACCFSCKYCGSSGGHARENELTLEECRSVAKQLADLGCERVSLIGGEVFLRRDWDQIVEALTSLGIRTLIITNGFLFTDPLIRKLKETSIESIAVSIDGPEAVHDKYRQEGSFRRAIGAVAALTSAGIPTTVISTLNRENVPQLGSLLEILQQYPIAAWQLQACSPMGNAAKAGIDFRFDPRDVIRFVETYAGHVPFLLGIADNIGYFTPGEGHLRGNIWAYAPFTGCHAGLTVVGIDSVGNVRGCESLYDPSFIEGNLRERSLRDIWEDPNAFAYNRGFKPDMLTGACRTCPYGTKCAGGCRSYNYFTHGKLYESQMCARNIEPVKNES